MGWRLRTSQIEAALGTLNLRQCRKMIKFLEISNFLENPHFLASAHLVIRFQAQFSSLCIIVENTTFPYGTIRVREIQHSPRNYSSSRNNFRYRSGFGKYFTFRHNFLACALLRKIGGMLFKLQPFSTERYELEKKLPRSKRLCGTFKIALVPQIAEIMGIFKFLNTTFLYGTFRVRGNMLFYRQSEAFGGMTNLH